MSTEKQHRILIAMDESRYADYAFNCKYDCLSCALEVFSI